MKNNAFIAKTNTFFSKVPLLGWIIGGGLFAVVLTYSLIFFIPKTVQFSYAETTCVSQLVVAPSLQKAASDQFTIEFKDEIKIGNVTLASTKVCLEPTQSPAEGKSTASFAPFGSFIARKQLSIEVPAPPLANASDLVGKKISTAQPLKIELTSPDMLHQYQLKVADKSATCEQVDSELTCNVATLELAHGTQYTVALHQQYKTVDKKVIEGQVETLQPLLLNSASISEGQVIYDAPTSFSFSFDRPLESTDITLVKLAGESVEKIPTTITTDGPNAQLSFEALARESQYRVDMSEAIGDNGSSLAAPISYSFTTSGGPKPSSVSVGANSVPRTATITVTFDQPIDESVDITKLARVEGINGSVRKKSDTQVTFSIQGGDCSAFSLVVDKGIKSGSNGESSKEAWKFNSRTICGYSWNIGSSVQGRSITAYSFGSGSQVILFTAGIHGSEPSSTTTMQAWVKHLQAYGDIVPANKRVVVVPNTNPDGIARGSRNNANNVNLGRNFPTANWSASIETASGTLPYGGGTSPGSEPEAAALIALTRQLRPRLEISYHAQGSLVGANKFADSVSIGDTYAKTVGYRTMFYNAEAVMGYAMTGEYEDWMGESMNIPAILIELPRASGNYLSTQLSALKKMLAL